MVPAFPHGWLAAQPFDDAGEIVGLAGDHLGRLLLVGSRSGPA